jgi:hypothetical protein
VQSARRGPALCRCQVSCHKREPGLHRLDAPLEQRQVGRRPYLSGVGFFESKQTSKEERGNRKEEDVSFWYDTRKSHSIGGMRCLIGTNYPSGNRPCQRTCRI